MPQIALNKELQDKLTDFFQEVMGRPKVDGLPVGSEVISNTIGPVKYDMNLWMTGLVSGFLWAFVWTPKWPYGLAICEQEKFNLPGAITVEVVQWADKPEDGEPGKKYKYFSKQYVVVPLYPENYTSTDNIHPIERTDLRFIANLMFMYAWVSYESYYGIDPKAYMTVTMQHKNPDDTMHWTTQAAVPRGAHGHYIPSIPNLFEHVELNKTNV